MLHLFAAAATSRSSGTVQHTLAWSMLQYLNTCKKRSDPDSHPVQVDQRFSPSKELGAIPLHVSVSDCTALEGPFTFMLTAIKDAIRLAARMYVDTIPT